MDRWWTLDKWHNNVFNTGLWRQTRNACGSCGWQYWYRYIYIVYECPCFKFEASLLIWLYECVSLMGIRSYYPWMKKSIDVNVYVSSARLLIVILEILDPLKSALPCIGNDSTRSSMKWSSSEYYVSVCMLVNILTKLEWKMVMGCGFWEGFAISNLAYEPYTASGHLLLPVCIKSSGTSSLLASVIIQHASFQVAYRIYK
jgi:hypothetical protein